MGPQLTLSLKIVREEFSHNVNQGKKLIPKLTICRAEI